MIKKIVFTFCAVVMSMAATMAQEAVAVLTHEGTSKSYTGYHALMDAYADATDGDMITLSSGTFRAVEQISKAITIRGAGMETDTIYNTLPTILVGKMYLNHNGNYGHRFHLEGIYHDDGIWYTRNVVNPEFVKCRLGEVGRGSYTVEGKTTYGFINGATFLHCKITGKVTCAPESTMSFVNSYIYEPSTVNDSTSIMSFRNCVIRIGIVRGCNLTNTIFDSNYSSPYNKYTRFNNCWISSAYTPDVTTNSYKKFDTWGELFKTFKGTYSNTETFEMHESYNSEYGIYGGSFPYSPRVAGPHIKQFEVAPRSTDSGTLNVRVKIETTKY